MKNNLRTKWTQLLPVVVMCLLAGRLSAATITVTTAVDEVNGNTSSVAALIATPGGAGISLREAIIATNNTAGADIILFAAGLNGVPITLTRVGDDATALNGDLDISDHLTITGNGQANTIIQGATDASFTGSIGDKVLGINQDGTHLGLTVSISGLTIRYARNANPASGAFSHTGGGVDVFLTGVGNSITFTNCTITNCENVNGWGGGVNVDSGTSNLPGDVNANTSNRGTVSFIGCTITNNKTDASSGPGLEGGGLNLYADIHDVVITNCTITGNQTLDDVGNGGGINIRHSYGGTVTISGGSISNNSSSGIAGGLTIEGNQHVSMINVLVDGNSSTNAVSRAGGISITCLGVAGFTANISLSSVTISNNHADNGAGEGGGLYFNSPYGATLTNCSITGNTSKTGAGIQNAGGTTGPIILAISGGSITNNVAATTGGGLSHEGSPTTTTITNCSITGNTATGNGGGLRVTNGIVTLDGCTISNNTADSDNNSSGDGGGIFHNGGTLNLNNTITIGSAGSGNSATNGGGIANISGNLSKTAGLLTIASNNAKNHGGGLYITGGTINLQKTAIVSNTANSDNAGGGEGGGLYNGGGTLTLNFNRIALNTANANTTSNALRQVSGTITNIQNNWWGTNSPATVINGTAAFTPNLQLTHTPAAASICPSNSTGLTASFVNNSAGTNVLANLDRLIGLPITFGNATPAGSSISGAQTSIQASGTATATFNAGTTPGVGGADATVDNFPSHATITVLAPPNVTLDPSSQSICPGAPVTFTAAATGNPTPTVQWQVSTNGGMSFSNLAGATNTTLMFNVATADNGKQYRAVFTNICNTDISAAAVLTVYPVENPAFAYGKNAYCKLGSNPTPTIFGDPGGTFTAPAQVSITPGTGQINLAASTAGGPYTITYTTGGPCPQSATFSVSIVVCVPTATLTDALIVDNLSLGKADPGDRIRLTATINNAQSADYQGVQLVLNNDPRVTLVPASFKSTPVAVDDAYTAGLNTPLVIAAGSGLLQNDFDDNIPGLSVTAFSAASAQGGTVSVSASGGFTYTPPANFTGNDSFNYTITDSDSQTNSGVAKIRVQ